MVKQIKKIQYKDLHTHTIQSSVQIPIDKRQKEIWAGSAEET